MRKSWDRKPPDGLSNEVLSTDPSVERGAIRTRSGVYYRFDAEPIRRPGGRGEMVAESTQKPQGFS